MPGPKPITYGEAVAASAAPTSRLAWNKMRPRTAEVVDGYKSEYQFQLEMQEQIRKFDEMMGAADPRAEASEGAWLLQSHPEMLSRKQMAEKVLQGSTRGPDRGTFRPHAAPVNASPVPAGPPPSGSVYMLLSGKSVDQGTPSL